MRKLILLTAILLAFNAHSQNNSNNVASILKEHLNSFRSIIGNDAEVAIIVDYDFDNGFSEKEHFVKPEINPKKIVGDKNYLVKVFFMTDKNASYVRLVNFKITKTGRRKLTFTNMGGTDYKL